MLVVLAGSNQLRVTVMHYTKTNKIIMDNIKLVPLLEM